MKKETTNLFDLKRGNLVLNTSSRLLFIVLNVSDDNNIFIMDYFDIAHTRIEKYITTEKLAFSNHYKVLG